MKELIDDYFLNQQLPKTTNVQWWFFQLTIEQLVTPSAFGHEFGLENCKLNLDRAVFDE